MKLLIFDKLEINRQLKLVWKKVEVFYYVSRDIFNMVADNGWVFLLAGTFYNKFL